MKYSATPTEELRDLLIDKLFENPNDLVVEDTIDYITNTQKEITKLQQENKQLKEQLEYLRSNEYLNQVKWERDFNEKLVNDLKEKIDKANEILSKSCFEYDNCPDNVINEIIELKEILGDKENE